MLESTWCRKHMGVFDLLVRRLRSAGPDGARHVRAMDDQSPPRSIHQPLGSA
jgi:hypothetical protein